MWQTKSKETLPDHIAARTGLLLVSEAFRQRDTHPAARQLRPSETAQALKCNRATPQTPLNSSLA